jgi:hypothetical protein
MVVEALDFTRMEETTTIIMVEMGIRTTMEITSTIMFIAIKITILVMTMEVTIVRSLRRILVRSFATIVASLDIMPGTVQKRIIGKTMRMVLQEARSLIPSTWHNKTNLPELRFMKSHTKVTEEIFQEAK